MNKPALYHKFHAKAKEDVGDFIRKNFSKFSFNPNGCDNFIDVGTGPGDVFMQYIYPLLPLAKCNRLVLSDISKDMLEFLKQYYQTPSKFEFCTFDIQSKKGLPNNLEGQFDHVTSCLVLHWVPDNGMALKNIFNLLRPDGDCLLIFYSYNGVFEVHSLLSASPKWSQYTKGVRPNIACLQNVKNPKEIFHSMMLDAGFSDISIDLRYSVYGYESVEHLNENVISVCDILDLIPKHRQPEFLDDYVEVMIDIAKRKRGLSGKAAEAVIVADVMMAYGKRRAEN